MGLPVEVRQRFSVGSILGTGDSTLELMPAVTGYTYVVISATLTCLVSAAQVVYLGDSSGTKKALQVFSNFPAHSQAVVQLLEGLKLTESESLVLKPAAAGPSFHVVVEGYILKSSGSLV